MGAGQGDGGMQAYRIRIDEGTQVLGNDEESLELGETIEKRCKTIYGTRSQSTAERKEGDLVYSRRNPSSLAGTHHTVFRVFERSTMYNAAVKEVIFLIRRRLYFTQDRGILFPTFLFSSIKSIYFLS